MQLTHSKRSRIRSQVSLGTRWRVELRENVSPKNDANGTVALHQRYLYRGYLQIASYDIRQADPTAPSYIIWDPTQPVATRPLVIRKDQTWYTYGWDLTKNICELYNNTGYILNLYTYTPYGSITAYGDVEQPIQWSSEYNDEETNLVYYNYRYYNPTDGRWMRRDPIGGRGGLNLYSIIDNKINYQIDYHGIVSVQFENCDSSSLSKDNLQNIVEQAESLLIRKIDGLTPEKAKNDAKYLRLFGKFSLARYNHVMETFHQIKRIFANATITIDCCTCFDTPDEGAYAYVYPNDGAYKIYLCSLFYSANDDTAFSSKVTAILHELTHEVQINPTDDIENPWYSEGSSLPEGPYGQSYAEWIAEHDAWIAVYNADNYEYYLSDSP